MTMQPLSILRWASILLACGAGLVTVVSNARAEDASSDLDRVIVDWNEEDYRLDRVLFVRAYLYHDTQPVNPWDDYLRAVNWDDRADSLGSEAFANLPRERQDARRKRARDAVYRAVLAVRDPALRFAQNAQDGYQPCLTANCLPPSGSGVGVTRALRQLTLAVGLDPGSLLGWYHLAYFSELVGDVHRAARARARFFELDRTANPDLREKVGLLRRRAILDEAWALREAGRYDQCVAWIEAQLDQLRGNPDQWQLSPLNEARLIWGLVRAEQGQWVEARELAHALPILPIAVRNWVVWQLPEVGSGPNLSSYSYAWYDRITDESVKITNLNFDKGSWEHRKNDFLRRWIFALGELRSGREDEARRLLGEPDWELEYLPGIVHRWWQDLGQIYEQLDEMPLARRCYARGAVYRPYFLYLPLIGARGMPEVHTAQSTGTPYHLIYRTFFAGGSLYSYAANCALACEAEPPGPERDLLFATAFERLAACRNRGLHAAEVAALQGRLHFLSEDLVAAEADLKFAHRELTDQGREDADVQLMLGLVRLNQEDFAGAVPWLHRFTELKPEAAAGWRALGLAEAFRGRDHEAMAALDRAVHLDPDVPSALFNRGLLHYRAGNREAALADFERAAELWPENEQIASMVEVTREGPLLDLEMTASPVRLEVDEAERERIAQVREGSKLGVGSGVAGDLGALSVDERETVLDRLRRAYREEPSPAVRSDLAWTALVSGRPELTQEVLVPLWPAVISTGELNLLLQADRARGDSARAADLATRGEAGRRRWPDPEIWALAAAICLDHGETLLALQALDEALLLDPANVTLQNQRDRLRTVAR